MKESVEGAEPESAHKVEIPEDIQEICREFGRLAQKHKLRNLSVSFEPSLDHPWGAKISMGWEWGRHGDDMNELRINSQYNIFTTVNNVKL